MLFRSLIWEELQEKGVATHSLYPCLENPWTEESAWLATVPRIAKNRTQLK